MTESTDSYMQIIQDAVRTSPFARNLASSWAQEIARRYRRQRIAKEDGAQ